MNTNHVRPCFLSGAALLLSLAGTSEIEAQSFPPARVEVALAELREMAPVADLPGTVVSINDSRIASEVEGVLVSLADVGAAVEQGEIIARIAPELLRIGVQRAEANVGRLASEFQYRERQLARTLDLASKNSVSRTGLDEAQAARDQAEHALDDARAALALARTNLERSEIRAPFAGHVSARFAAVGEYVGVGEDVLRLVDTHTMEIALPAPIALARFLRPGAMVSVRNNGQTKQHAIRTVVPVGDDVSRMVEVRLSVAEGDWLVGQPVQVSLPKEQPISTVAVPRDALVQRGNRSYVVRLNDDGQAEQVTVGVNATVDLWVGVSEGIAAGDRVVIRGAERLQPGQPVEVIETVGRN
jgi:RND family efflux transporter MFP subunit